MPRWPCLYNKRWALNVLMSQRILEGQLVHLDWGTLSHCEPSVSNTDRASDLPAAFRPAGGGGDAAAPCQLNVTWAVWRRRSFNFRFLSQRLVFFPSSCRSSSLVEVATLVCSL